MSGKNMEHVTYILQNKCIVQAYQIQSCLKNTTLIQL
jgi:hypothetical protein